jgi:hypothetical protein
LLRRRTHPGLRDRADLAPAAHIHAADTAFYDIAEVAGGSWLRVLTSVSTSFAFGISCAIVCQSAIARIPFAMARDRQIPALLAPIHPRTRAMRSSTDRFRDDRRAAVPRDGHGARSDEESFLGTRGNSSSALLRIPPSRPLDPRQGPTFRGALQVQVTWLAEVVRGDG